MTKYVKYFLLVITMLGAFAVSAQNEDLLPQRFLGKYTSNVCDTCYWVVNADGFGEWSVGFNSGATVVPFLWEPMIDENENLQEAKRGDETGYVLKITYMGILSEDVKSTMISSHRDSSNAIAILWYDDNTEMLQFMSKTNAFYDR